jgi:predicted chitinase
MALSIVLANTTSRSGVRNDAYRNEVHAASMANLVRHGRVDKIEYPNETYYAITAKGRDYYEACTGHVVDDLLFEEDVCYA